MGFITKETRLDSGSGTTVIKVDYPFFSLAKKVFNLEGSQKIGIAQLKAYQWLTNELVSGLEATRSDLVTRSLPTAGEAIDITWKINPILHVGEENHVLHTISPFVEGRSVADLLADKEVDSLLKLSLREELGRMARLLEYRYPYYHLHLTALNVTLSPTTRPNRFFLIVTNIRESVTPHRHPIPHFARRDSRT